MSVVRWTRVTVAVCLVLTGCSDAGHASDTASTTARSSSVTNAAPERLSFTVVASHPHDPSAFTEGLAFGSRDRLYESSGHYGQSRIAIVDPQTGAARTSAALGAEFFGEGLAVVGDTVIQLTWKEGAALRWAADDLTSTGRSAYEGEGWGLTYDPAARRLYQSDGTATLHVRRTDDFAETRSVEVRRAGSPVDQLNELEWVDGQLWANVWKSDELLRIDPSSGRVTGVVDLASLDEHLSAADPDLVLNGIAHRPGDPANRLWVTGKGWSTMTEIEIETAG